MISLFFYIEKKSLIINELEFKENNIKSKMILQVHDELIFDCLKSEQEQVESIIKNVMEHVCELSVPLKVDIESGINWYDAK